MPQLDAPADVREEVAYAQLVGEHPPAAVADVERSRIGEAGDPLPVNVEAHNAYRHLLRRVDVLVVGAEFRVALDVVVAEPLQPRDLSRPLEVRMGSVTQKRLP